jgi:hypothetical protein
MLRSWIIARMDCICTSKINPVPPSVNEDRLSTRSRGAKERASKHTVLSLEVQLQADQLQETRDGGDEGGCSRSSALFCYSSLQRRRKADDRGPQSNGLRSGLPLLDK